MTRSRNIIIALLKVSAHCGLGFTPLLTTYSSFMSLNTTKNLRKKLEDFFSSDITKDFECTNAFIKQSIL
jgi:hypothetical protein